MQHSSKSQKNILPLDKNNDQDISSKMLIEKIKDIHITKLKKNSKEKKTIIQKMKNKGLVK